MNISHKVSLLLCIIFFAWPEATYAPSPRFRSRSLDSYFQENPTTPPNPKTWATEHRWTCFKHPQLVCEFPYQIDSTSMGPFLTRSKTGTEHDPDEGFCPPLIKFSAFDDCLFIITLKEVTCWNRVSPNQWEQDYFGREISSLPNIATSKDGATVFAGPFGEIKGNIQKISRTPETPWTVKQTTNLFTAKNPQGYGPDILLGYALQINPSPDDNWLVTVQTQGITILQKQPDGFFVTHSVIPQIEPILSAQFSACGGYIFFHTRDVITILRLNKDRKKEEEDGR